MAESARAIIRYDGPALAGHEMDVRDLAPALLALGDLCRIANERLNGDAASVKVMVRADQEHKCFELGFELVQTIYEQVASLLKEEGVKEAKDILEWLGLISGGTVGAGVSFLALIRLIANRKSKDKQSIEVKAGDNSFIYVVNGTSVTVPPEVHKIASDEKAIEAAKKIMSPLEKEGYETLSFEDMTGNKEVFSREDARKIIDEPNITIVSHDDNELVSKIHTAVKIRKAVYEGNAAWTVIYKRVIDAKMLDEVWLEDFQHGRVQAPPGSRLVVDLEERVPVDNEGMETGGSPSYAIIKVHGVVPPPHQHTLV